MGTNPWTKIVDKFDDSVYYFNKITKETKWEEPLGFKDMPKSEDSLANKCDTINDNTHFYSASQARTKARAGDMAKKMHARHLATAKAKVDEDMLQWKADRRQMLAQKAELERKEREKQEAEERKIKEEEERLLQIERRKQ